MMLGQCLQIIKEKQSFQRVEVTREEALDMFQENKFKVEIIGGLPQVLTSIDASKPDHRVLRMQVMSSSLPKVVI